MTEKQYVFVYGTLQTGESNHHYLEGTRKSMEQCWVLGEIVDLGFYPGLIPGGEKRVYGELYEISEEQLHVLDQLEKDYKRMRQLVIGDRSSIEAWTYVYPYKQTGDDSSLIKSGNWKWEQQSKQKTEWFYFAYGSCMDQKRFQLARKEHFFQRILGRGSVPGYTFRYTCRARDGKGRADIVEGEGWVEGIVYRIGVEALEYLYEREGVANGVYRPAPISVHINGELVTNVLTFLVVDKVPDTKPPIDYVTEIIRGGKAMMTDRYFNHLKEYHVTKFGIELDHL